MSTESTESTVRAWYGNLVEGKMEAVLAGMTEDVVFEIPKTPFNAIVPWAGLWKGRDQVMEAFRRRNEVLDLKVFELKELVSEGEGAFALIHEKSVNKRTGKPFDIMIVQEVAVRGRQLSSWKAYYDSYPVISSFHQLDTSTLEGLNRELVLAVADNDLARVENVLELGGDANTRARESGLTVLMMAAAQANPKLVETLLRRGADVFTTDSKTGATALHKACQGGSVEVARLLVEAGAFVDAVTPTMGHTPLMDALWYTWPDMVRFLVDQGANLNLSTHYGFSMMEHFKFELQVNTAGKDKLLQIGEIFKSRQEAIDKDIAGQKVMAATNKGDSRAVRKMIAEGAEVNTVYPHVNSFLDGHTPLLVAARDGHTAIVADLLKAGAKARVQDWIFKGAPIHKATYNGNTEILKLILTAPDVDIDVQGPINGYTALHDALWHGYAECAEILIDAGADLKPRGHDGKRAVDVAIETLGVDHPLVGKIKTKMQQGG